jgi:hypothetical protein
MMFPNNLAFLSPLTAGMFALWGGALGAACGFAVT